MFCSILPYMYRHQLNVGIVRKRKLRASKSTIEIMVTMTTGHVTTVQILKNR